jgi:hypothetical protein
MNIETFTAAFKLIKDAINLAKDANGLIPDSPKRRAADIALAQAEQQLRFAETQAAQDLGYNLCQCTFPPQIALLQPNGSKRCPKCGRDTDENLTCFEGNSH